MTRSLKNQEATTSRRNMYFIVWLAVGFGFLSGLAVSRGYIDALQTIATASTEAKYSADENGSVDVLEENSAYSLNDNINAAQDGDSEIDTHSKPQKPIITAQTIAATVQNSKLGYFLAHIPKTGGYYVYATLNKFHDAMQQNIPPEQQQAFCDEGLQPLKNYRATFNDNRTCTIHMSEVWPWKVKDNDYGYTDIAHKYIAVRDPVSHVLSMYFHCTESNGGHKKYSHLMPSLNEWLEAWADARDNQTKFEENDKFHCYKPLDYESNYIHFDPDNGRGKDFLKENYDVVGDFSKLPQYACAIFIKHSGQVPPECNCSGIKEGKRRRHLSAHDHGVIHHCSSFEVTDMQRALILEQLRPMDAQLYPIVQQIFAEQVKELEQQYNFEMCEQLRSFDENEK